MDNINKSYNITNSFLCEIPEHPGVYIMKDKNGQVLYIGKSLNLKARVKSYFKKSSDIRYSVRFIRKNVKSIEFSLTSTEKEALILENNLIKKLKPRYNIRLRDDKNFFYIKINRNETFPRIELIRKRKHDGASYFGPYSSSKNLKETLRHLNTIYPLRSCKNSLFKNRSRPCLLYQINKCSAPCCGKISVIDYNAMVDDIILILKCKKQMLIKKLKSAMHKASDNFKFEHAAMLRDRIYAIENSLEKQEIISSNRTNKDIIGIALNDKYVSFNILQVIEGRLEGTDNFLMNHNEIPIQDIISSFIQQFYHERPIPRTIYLKKLPEDNQALQEWLKDRSGKNVSIISPRRGTNIKLLNQANMNALQNLLIEKERDNDLLVLKNSLGLKNFPNRIECFDISTFQGDSPVGSNIVFIDGQPKKTFYRKYNIKTVTGQDDFAMIREVLHRRLTRTVQDKDYPDLCIIDGGKGQLSCAFDCYTKMKDNLPHIDFIALAKEPKNNDKKISERVFLPNRKNPIILREGTGIKNFLDRIRDEAHRFAVTSHRRKRKIKKLTSKLISIHGIGKHREKLLIQHFGSVKKLKSASLEQILHIPSIGPSTAKIIFGYFHPDLI